MFLYTPQCVSSAEKEAKAPGSTHFVPIKCARAHWRPVQEAEIEKAASVHQPYPTCLTYLCGTLAAEQAKEQTREYSVYLRIFFSAHILAINRGLT